jgi:hypothetical protein
MLQPVPGLGSPGFGRVGRRSRSSSGRVRRPRWRATLRRLPPRRQPCHIAAACSPPAVPLPDPARRRGETEWLDPSLPAPSFPTNPPAPEAVFRPPLGDGCVAPVRRPSVRERVAPLSPATCAWTVSNGRSPGSGIPTVAHLAMSRLSARGPSDDRLSPIVSWPPPRLPRLLVEAIDLEPRAGHRCPALGPFRWWLSAPTLNLQGSASIASCPRPP